MTRIGSNLFLGLALFLMSGVANAGADGWHASLDDGLEAAKTSGRPLLVVTGWKSGV